jgi:ribosomal protein S18 acetylase RimI-like enzyme
MEIRPLSPSDRPQLAALLGRIETFSPDEVSCALELIDAAAQPNHPDYVARVAAEQDRVLGYVCYGPTPMTDGTYDLYWIASDPLARGKGVGRALLAAMEGDLRERRARVVRVETSAQEAYGATRGFYAAMEYAEESRFRDFYRQGEDLVVLAKRL